MINAYYVLVIALSVYLNNIIYFSQQPYETVTIIPSLQMEKLRLQKKSKTKLVSIEEWMKAVWLWNLCSYILFETKYSAGLPEILKGVQANVELLIPPDETHSKYELISNDSVQNVCFQLVHLELEMDFHTEMLL